MKKVMKLLSVAVILVSPFAHAHGIHDGLSVSLLNGFFHPFLGLDHLLILLAMGIASQMSCFEKLKGGLFILAALCMMGAGFVFGLWWEARSVMEALILGSVFVAGFAVWKLNSGSWLAKALVTTSLLAVSIHGWAHGVEVGHASLATFAIGMLMGSVVIMVLGSQLVKLVSSQKLAAAIVSCGVLIGVIG
ncbi:HupE/UreJ family protein [Vibrio sp. 10N]|uniref:HupE/UreJ family protein n=1 Tax=Vibrio sp. 10N TaxID=3058938 RepID=UPI0028140461|nr:HupE/UreJ family protein [Vibrio sp. 10N]